MSVRWRTYGESRPRRPRHGRRSYRYGAGPRRLSIQRVRKRTRELRTRPSTPIWSAMPLVAPTRRREAHRRHVLAIGHLSPRARHTPGRHLQRHHHFASVRLLRRSGSSDDGQLPRLAVHLPRAHSQYPPHAPKSSSRASERPRPGRPCCPWADSSRPRQVYGRRRCAGVRRGSSPVRSGSCA